MVGDGQEQVVEKGRQPPFDVRRRGPVAEVEFHLKTYHRVPEHHRVREIPKPLPKEYILRRPRFRLEVGHGEPVVRKVVEVDLERVVDLYLERVPEQGLVYLDPEEEKVGYLKRVAPHVQAREPVVVDYRVVAEVVAVQRQGKAGVWERARPRPVRPLPRVDRPRLRETVAFETRPHLGVDQPKKPGTEGQLERPLDPKVEFARRPVGVGPVRQGDE